MVSLKLSHPGLFGPLQLEDPAAGGIGDWPVHVTVGLVWDTVPLEGVAAEAAPGRSTMAKARQTANSRRRREHRSGARKKQKTQSETNRKKTTKAGTAWDHR